LPAYVPQNDRRAEEILVLLNLFLLNMYFLVFKLYFSFVLIGLLELGSFHLFQQTHLVSFVLKDVIVQKLIYNLTLKLMVLSMLVAQVLPVVFRDLFIAKALRSFKNDFFQSCIFQFDCHYFLRFVLL